ncbi:hypothetical protein B0J18DRAFT_274018 [Chaetomium sp. MPI-SDFR-AT-0129]|nr:hypothetical protein B0J18DRAFT_274018 [Chaetomium sp. MPI-SDFR-AT-0129]
MATQTCIIAPLATPCLHWRPLLSSMTVLGYVWHCCQEVQLRVRVRVGADDECSRLQTTLMERATTKLTPVVLRSTDSRSSLQQTSKHDMSSSHDSPITESNCGFFIRLMSDIDNERHRVDSRSYVRIRTPVAVHQHKSPSRPKSDASQFLRFTIAAARTPETSSLLGSVGSLAVGSNRTIGTNGSFQPEAFAASHPDSTSSPCWTNRFSAMRPHSRRQSHKALFQHQSK